MFYLLSFISNSALFQTCISSHFHCSSVLLQFYLSSCFYPTLLPRNWEQPTLSFAPPFNLLIEEKLKERLDQSHPKSFMAGDGWNLNPSLSIPGLLLLTMAPPWFSCWVASKANRQGRGWLPSLVKLLASFLFSFTQGDHEEKAF